jgi:hypothetical protein
MRSAGSVDAWRERLESGDVPATPQQVGDAQEPVASHDVGDVQEPVASQEADEVEEPATSDNGNGHHPDVSVERIQQLAYELFEHGAPGGALDHWLEAERTLA